MSDAADRRGFRQAPLKRAGEVVMIIGALVSAGGGLWLKNFVLSARAFGVCLSVIVIGFGIMALGGGLLKLARSRKSNGDTAT